MSKNENKKGTSALVSIFVMRKRSHRLLEMEINFITVSFCKFPNFMSFLVSHNYSISKQHKETWAKEIKTNQNSKYRTIIFKYLCLVLKNFHNSPLALIGSSFPLHHVGSKAAGTASRIFGCASVLQHLPELTCCSKGAPVPSADLPHQWDSKGGRFCNMYQEHK